MFIFRVITIQKPIPLFLLVSSSYIFINSTIELCRLYDMYNTYKGTIYTSLLTLPIIIQSVSLLASTFLLVNITNELNDKYILNILY